MFRFGVRVRGCVLVVGVCEFVVMVVFDSSMSSILCCVNGCSTFMGLQEYGITALRHYGREQDSFVEVQTWDLQQTVRATNPSSDPKHV